MKLVLQRAAGDCAVAALATLLEAAYEDVYVAAAAVDPVHRGKSGAFTTTAIRIAAQLGARLVLRRPRRFEDVEGLLRVTWEPRTRRASTEPHFVAVSYGVIADPTDGLILPADEYLLRERAKAGLFLELA